MSAITTSQGGGPLPLSPATRWHVVAGINDETYGYLSARGVVPREQGGPEPVYFGSPAEAEAAAVALRALRQWDDVHVTSDARY